MKIGLIDVDGHNFPNLALMKISAKHKQDGDAVEWYDPLLGGNYDRVYMSKVFGFTNDYAYPIRAEEIIKGGTGYAIKGGADGETFNASANRNLPPEIEHMMPDYSIYGINDEAFGFLSRGCPRGCGFCIVSRKEGNSHKVADLSEFWNGQKKITLLDPNFLACKDKGELFEQLKESGAAVEFNQGLDIRCLTDKDVEHINNLRVKNMHFAFDRVNNYAEMIERFEMLAGKLNKSPRAIGVYVLVNFETSLAEDLRRIYDLRRMGFSPFVMRYNKEQLERGNIYNSLARWVNNRAFFWKHGTFEEYLKNETRIDWRGKC